MMNLEYIDNPTIKLSQAEHLNDPFESNPCDNIYESIKHIRLKVGFSNDEAERHANEYRVSIKNRLTLNGIVSFSETPRNSLMWAHYGNHHHGICIGFKKNLFDDLQLKESIFNVSVPTPRKVNYDNFRMEDDYEVKDIKNELNELISHHLFTKSDEWIYEKEHRSIIPLSAAKKVKLVNPESTYQLQSDHIKNAKDLILHLISKNELTHSEEENVYNIAHSENMDATMFMMASCNAGIIFLIDVNPSHIDSIYLGCKVKTDLITQFKQRIANSYNKSIKLYKFNVSTTRFELISERVNVKES